MADLAFIATRTATTLDPTAIVAAAAAVGRTWQPIAPDSDDGSISFQAGDATVVVMAIDAIHPDIPSMPVGPTGADPEELAATQGHLIVTALGLSGDEVIRDSDMAALASVVVAAVDAVGVMLGHNVYFHRCDVFRQLVEGNAAEDRPALPVLVTVTVAGDGNGRMSFLSHGMERYGREDLYVTCSVEGTGAVPFVYDTLTWFFDLEMQLPTGDSIGRDESERIEVQRVVSPAHPERMVVRLDLD